MERRRRKSIFDIFNDLFREIEEEFQEFIEEAERLSAFEPTEYQEKIIGPVVYGFRITIGPDGRPKIQEFGNVRKAGRAPKISEELEPLVDVLDEGDKVRIVAEIPGVEKEKIKLKAVGRKLIIQASNGKKYYKEVELPDAVDIKTAKAHYRNGVLEVEVEKVKKKADEIEIKVE